MCTNCQTLDPSIDHYDTHGVSSFSSGDISVSNNKPVYAYDQIANYLTEGFWSDFNTTARHYDAQSGDTITHNLDGLNSTGTAAAGKVFEAWTAVSSLQFTEVSKAQTQMMFGDNNSGASASSSVSGGHIIQSTINIHNSWADNPDYYHQNDSRQT
ncbi:hypothetical protein [Yoonia sediminilitoris]|uniref:Uncharacterized protein n=1 Tax=Yoonia sediminilitoris TaxID=1286148 RepID=A0A2T6KIX0_9RHOB|nr:hypothetical protein [Yoonia sediminilitoris]PUB15667.1 hypothetical protein C8N45_104287 [Yoonia sediminilitoris]RCW96276.1 hypothetical protein DFP92_104286 [Yoonia sediminilitoris]